MDVSERFPSGSLSAILITHFHPDHVQGLFHWRWGLGELAVFAPHDAQGCADLYTHPGPLKFNHLSKFETFQIGDMRITPVPLVHSKPTLGYCIEHDGARMAYLSDCSALPPATAAFLTEWQPHRIFLDCTYPPGMVGNHFDLTEAIAVSEDYPNSNVVLMHISHILDTWLLNHPEVYAGRVSLARDGDTFEV